ncbi:MAG: valine--tRNA ligase [Bdellovibrionota bacterium]|nr:valine--tRNA ligase [Bdellovibrionota bacterium]
MKSKELPKKYKANEAEIKWGEFWESQGVYKYNPGISREETFVIDTPPPTVSGSLHVGHVFSYTQTDVIARYQRMKGKNIFYPMGWDDNGLPTERRVQGLYGVRCNPLLPYKEDWQGKASDKKKKVEEEISRKNFLEVCQKQTAEDEIKYEKLWRHLGLSLDWGQQYETINDHCRKVSQISFLDLQKKNLVDYKESPTLWDTTFQTAVAQAEVEEREKGGHFHDIRFTVEGGGDFVISTTRPELLGACVAVVAHPEDERYQGLFGKHAITPLFNAKVPIMPAEHADKEKGSGILMVCTFGDIHDVEFWKQEGLPLRQIIEKEGTIGAIKYGTAKFPSENPEKANEVSSQLKGLYVKQARKKVVDLLREEAFLVGEPKPTQQFTKHYEKGDHPLEYISTRQWFVKVLDYKKELIEQGRKVKWHPETMFKRYEQWVEGLNQDWCISRQRFFGVAFPVWYPLDENSRPDYENPIYASQDQLPVDPLSETPKGYTEDQRGKPNGFMGDPDVMDTWATSSLTPQISSHWGTDDERHKSLFPADLRPQAHEIIRTWAFYTITKAWMHDNEIPWKNIAISGWVVDPHKKKMSKSKGNVVTPESLIDQYSSDALRYWATKAKLGSDTIYDESVFKIGQRLATKMFNASKFVFLQIEDVEDKWLGPENITEAVDRVWIEKLNKVIEDSTKFFEDYNYSSVLSQVESAFWEFCDIYLELVKTRAYKLKDSSEGRSALASLSYTWKSFIKLFAPFLPYICEEVWSWSFAEKEKAPSVHKSAWPKPVELTDKKEAGPLIDMAKEALTALRGEKTTAQKSLRWPIEALVLKGQGNDLERFREIEKDIAFSSNLKGNIQYVPMESVPEGKFFEFSVTLSENAD